ncbi:N-acetylmuramoyl-L-alanine amidase [Leisingera sp. ANG59]|uniref:N-acetylmuramoyl-L-alanine amidase n=1 Tax=Leisingera sp. ANG59 TaxID=2675221 RepID=UPI0015745BBC|nr:N-acetylmuramoyl-L-alanine amidase [Leisingera sp. ANG59]NSY38603.1 N-acetylmuramoyl-L-alanine amidase [Leisingera sp. ANG59]
MTPDQSGALWHPSPNFGPRRDGLTPSLIVLHYTAMETAEAALERLCDPVAEVSAHYLIGADGTLWQMVAEDCRAWHAGAGEWAGQEDINSRSIGIELDNLGSHPFSEPQMAALEALMRGIMQRRDIPPEGVIGHSCMAPGRKCDPGPRFDWARLARQGLAADGGGAPLPQTVTFAHFRAAAATAGFTAPSDDETLLAAVRLRFRPWARGPLTAEDFLPLA